MQSQRNEDSSRLCPPDPAHASAGMDILVRSRHPEKWSLAGPQMQEARSSTHHHETHKPRLTQVPAQALLTHPGQQHTCACARTSSRPQACKRNTNCTPACALLAGPAARITCPCSALCATLPAENAVQSAPAALPPAPPRPETAAERCRHCEALKCNSAAQAPPGHLSCACVSAPRLCVAWGGCTCTAHPQSVLGSAAPAGPL